MQLPHTPTLCLTHSLTQSQSQTQVSCISLMQRQSQTQPQGDRHSLTHSLRYRDEIVPGTHIETIVNFFNCYHVSNMLLYLQTRYCRANSNEQTMLKLRF